MEDLGIISVAHPWIRIRRKLSPWKMRYWPDWDIHYQMTSMAAARVTGINYGHKGSTNQWNPAKEGH